ncbi:MAG: hypothetical protein R3C62_14605 [Chloroflexota bacterium]
MKVVLERVAQNSRIGIVTSKDLENLRQVALRQMQYSRDAAIEAIVQAKLAQLPEHRQGFSPQEVCS